MTRHAAKLVIAVVLLIYPLVIYFADRTLTPSELLAGLLVLLAARALVAAWIARRAAISSDKNGSIVRRIALAVVLMAGVVIVLAAFPNIQMQWLRFYPMLFDLAMFGIFFGSLFTERPLAERFARLMRHDMPPPAVVYTRRVTWVWSGILFAITLMSFYTAVGASFRVWSLFNGGIVYAVIGATFGCEYITRTYLRRRWEEAA